MKQFVKTLNTDGECFQHIDPALLGLSFEIKAGVFYGPQIHTLVYNQEFSRKMNDQAKDYMAFVCGGNRKLLQ